MCEPPEKDRISEEGILEERNMRTRLIVVVLAMVCALLGWRLLARQAEQQQSITVNSGATVMTDSDIQLLRQDLRAQKQKLIAQNLPMTETEAVKFWAVYNRYGDELRQINGEKYRLITEYAEQWPAMTNDQALIYIRRWLEVDQQVQQLRLKYVPEVSQVLPGKKAATFFQLDRRINMMIDIQLSSQLPLAHSSENP